MGATSKSKRERWVDIVKETGKCPFCPPHDKENAGKKQRSDKHKSKRSRRLKKPSEALL
jgi:hypothetical protein